MAGQAGRSRDRLIGRLTDNPQGYEFFQVVRILEALDPATARSGWSSSPQNEAIRFEQAASLSFPPADVANLTAAPDGRRWTLALHAFGLLGPHGPMPNVLTDYILGRLNRRDPALLRFINLFNHRLTGFYYRAWASANKAVDYDRARASGLDHSREVGSGGPRFRFFVSCLAGVASPAKARSDEVLHDAFLYFSGRFAEAVPNLEGLKSILSSFFDVPLEIEPFRQRRLHIPSQDQWRLGQKNVKRTLGLNTFLGTTVADRQSSFRIVLGPLGNADFHRLLPSRSGLALRNGRSFARLCALVKRYTHDQFFWDVQYVRKGAEVPPLRLPTASFTNDSIADLEAFVFRLVELSDGAAVLVHERLPAPVRRLLGHFEGQDIEGQIRSALVVALNQLAADESLAQQGCFTEVLLRPETARLMKQRPTGEALRLLNRLLLEDAYPVEVARGCRLGFDTWLRSETRAANADDLVVDPELHLSPAGLKSTASPETTSAAYDGN